MANESIDPKDLAEDALNIFKGAMDVKDGKENVTDLLGSVVNMFENKGEAAAPAEATENTDADDSDK